MNDQGEFYIGWRSKAPAGIGSHVRKFVVVVSLLVLGLACLFATMQRSIGVAVFEWGTIKPFNGILRAAPYPHLIVNRPGHSGGQSVYYLVAPLKFGLRPELLQGLDGKNVSLRGTLIYRENQTMIEALPESIKQQPDAAPISFLTGSTNLGRQTLVGEIVDSKCYLGVMNPGRLTPHRACAVRCISGGIPPVLLVRQENGAPLYFFLVSKAGHPVNKEVLDMVAEPVEITGDIVQQGELMILRADPSTYRRVK